MDPRESSFCLMRQITASLDSGAKGGCGRESVAEREWNTFERTMRQHESQLGVSEGDLGRCRLTCQKMLLLGSGGDKVGWARWVCVCNCTGFETLFPKWGAEPSLTGPWLPAAGWDGTWEARTGSGLVLMRGDFVTL